MENNCIKISFEHLIACIKTFGIKGFGFNFRFFEYKVWGLKNRPKRTKKLELKKYGNTPVYYRTNSSDIPLVHSILVWKGEYDVEVDSSKFDAILDLGANIGLFSVLYSLKYSGKKLIAVEPQSNNAEIARLNLGKNKDCKLIQSGIWWRRSNLKIVNHGTDWSFTVHETSEDNYDVMGIDIDTICNENGLGESSLFVKMDVEGTEKIIFEHLESAKWIDRTQYLVMEIHGTENGELYKSICTEMKKRGFDYQTRGENTFFNRMMRKEGF